MFRYFIGFYKLQPDALLEWRYLLPSAHPLSDRRPLAASLHGTLGWRRFWGFPHFPWLPAAAICGGFPLPDAAWSTARTAVSLYFSGHFGYEMPLGTGLGLAISIPLHYGFGLIRRRVAELCGLEVSLFSSSVP